MLSDWLVWCSTCTCAWLGQIIYYITIYCTIHFLITHLDIFFCRVWLLCRWLGGKKVLAVPYQVQACVFSGLLYAIVETLPSLIMKYDLPCSECNTEEWWCKIIFSFRIAIFCNKGLFSTWCLSTGKGLMCTINRSSIFFLLSIQIHLCDLVRSLYVNITVESQRKSQGLIWKVFSAGIPCLLMAVSYGGLSSYMYVMDRYSFLVSHAKHMSSVECGENCETSENYNLNVARHAFSCSMRFGIIWSVWCSCICIMPSSYEVLRCICFVW